MVVNWPLAYKSRIEDDASRKGPSIGIRRHLADKTRMRIKTAVHRKLRARGRRFAAEIQLTVLSWRHVDLWKRATHPLLQCLRRINSAAPKNRTENVKYPGYGFEKNNGVMPPPGSWIW